MARVGGGCGWHTFARSVDDRTVAAHRPGLAFVAHIGFAAEQTSSGKPVRPNLLRQLSAANGPQRPALQSIAPPPQQSVFAADDPFSSPFGPAPALATCLELETYRNEPLKVVSVVALSEAPSATSTGLRAVKDSINDRRALLRPSAVPAPAVIDVELDADVRVYIDPRCPETHAYLEQRFCAELVDETTRRTRVGLALALSEAEDVSTQFIMFGERIDLSADTASGSSVSELRLLIGRRRPTRKTVPRPDDPMPRGPSSLCRAALMRAEGLFNQALRRSASQPSLIKTFAAASAAKAPAARPSQSRPISATVRPTARNPLGQAPTGLKRKSSATPGRRGEKRARKTERADRSPSEAPSVMMGGSPTPSVAGTTLGDASWEVRNKNVHRLAGVAVVLKPAQTIRKALNKLLPQMGVDRKAKDFEAIFKMVKSGVAFALVRPVRLDCA